MTSTHNIQTKITPKQSAEAEETGKTTIRSIVLHRKFENEKDLLILVYLFINWRLIAPSNPQGHLREKEVEDLYYLFFEGLQPRLLKKKERKKERKIDRYIDQ